MSLSSARTPFPARVRAGLAGLLAVARAYALGTLRVLVMFVQNPELLPLALRAPLDLARQRRKPAAQLPALTRVSEGIWRVPLPERADDDEPSEQWVVLHYTGTGESVHSAYENTHHLFARESRLAHATHYIFEAPLHKGAYYGPQPFSAALWERVQPIVSHYEGPFVLAGVSRGGMVAIDHGMRIVEECGRVASVLSMSAPLDMPQRIPSSIRTIADFADVLTRFSDVWSSLFGPIQRRLLWIVENVYVMLTALVLRHHGVYDVESLARNARDLADCGVLDGALRATREFRLLLRVSERELALFRQIVVRALDRHSDRFFVAFVWGKKDAWIDADRCAARMQEASTKDAPKLALESEVIEGFGHLLTARDRDRHAAYQVALRRVVDAALCASARKLPELDPTLSLRAASSLSGEGPDE